MDALALGFDPGARSARAIDAEVRSIVEAEHKRAVAILSERRAVLDKITERLLETETLERTDLEALLQAEAPGL